MTAIENIHIFKTNIQSKAELETIKLLFNGHSGVVEWNVDLEDVDKVLRVTSADLSDADIINLLIQSGFECHELT